MRNRQTHRLVLFFSLALVTMLSAAPNGAAQTLPRTHDDSTS